MAFYGRTCWSRLHSHDFLYRPTTFWKLFSRLSRRHLDERRWAKSRDVQNSATRYISNVLYSPGLSLSPARPTLCSGNFIGPGRGNKMEWGLLPLCLFGIYSLCRISTESRPRTRKSRKSPTSRESVKKDYAISAHPDLYLRPKLDRLVFQYLWLRSTVGKGARPRKLWIYSWPHSLSLALPL